jgi:hypothetical protein
MNTEIEDVNIDLPTTTKSLKDVPTKKYYQSMPYS